MNFEATERISRQPSETRPSRVVQTMSDFGKYLDSVARLLEGHGFLYPYQQTRACSWLADAYVQGMTPIYAVRKIVRDREMGK